MPDLLDDPFAEFREVLKYYARREIYKPTRGKDGMLVASEIDGGQRARDVLSRLYGHV